MPDDLRVIVAGGGRVGFETTQVLVDHGHDVVVVESDPDRVDSIAEHHLATIIEGDATRPEVLRQADPDRADAVAALTGKAGTNVAVCTAADEITGGVRTVARIDGPDVAEYEELVDAVVYPERAGARVAANEILGSDVRSLADLSGDLDIVEVQAAEGAPAVGKTLAEIRLPRGSLVISGGDGHTVAQSDTTVEAGKTYLVALESDVADEVLNLFRG